MQNWLIATTTISFFSGVIVGWNWRSSKCKLHSYFTNCVGKFCYGSGSSLVDTKLGNVIRVKCSECKM